jgi:hypothetical protein
MSNNFPGRFHKNNESGQPVVLALMMFILNRVKD